MRRAYKYFCLTVYYSFAQWLPSSYQPMGGVGKWLRYRLVKVIFKKCGKNVTVERRVQFGSGRGITIGDNSGLGVNAVVPNNIQIGRDVMMGPDCYFLSVNHKFDRTDIPMWKQGYTLPQHPTIIEDNVWIGRQVTATPGRHISSGTVIGACCLLCKDFPQNSIVGGNPSKLIRSRVDESNG